MTRAEWTDAGRVLTTTVLLAAAVARAAGGQSSRVIPDQPECAACTIHVDRRAELIDDRPGGGFASRPNAVHDGGAGRVWVVAEGEPPRVFDARGHLLSAVTVADADPLSQMFFDVRSLPGDSMLVLDTGLRDATIIGPDDKVARRAALPGPTYGAAILHWPTTIAVNGLYPQDVPNELPLYTLSLAQPTAQVTRRFQSAPGERETGGGQLKVISDARDGTFWSADVGEYRLEQWDEHAQRPASFTRRASWFPPGTGTFVSPDGPLPRITAIEPDSLGLLWVFVSVPARTWRDAWGGGAGRRDVAIGAIPFEKLYQTIIEVIDPGAGRVFARSGRVAWILGALGPRRAVQSTLDSRGRRRLDVVELTLRGFAGAGRRETR